MDIPLLLGSNPHILMAISHQPPAFLTQRHYYSATGPLSHTGTLSDCMPANLNLTQLQHSLHLRNGAILSQWKAAIHHYRPRMDRKELQLFYCGVMSLMWRDLYSTITSQQVCLQSHFLAKDVCAGFPILAFSRHDTLYTTPNVSSSFCALHLPRPTSYGV
jgi:hypothetical protein